MISRKGAKARKEYQQAHWLSWRSAWIQTKRLDSYEIFAAFGGFA